MVEFDYFNDSDFSEWSLSADSSDTPPTQETSLVQEGNSSARIDAPTGGLTEIQSKPGDGLPNYPVIGSTISFYLYYDTTGNITYFVYVGDLDERSIRIGPNAGSYRLSVINDNNTEQDVFGDTARTAETWDWIELDYFDSASDEVTLTIYEADKTTQKDSLTLTGVTQPDAQEVLFSVDNGSKDTVNSLIVDEFGDNTTRALPITIDGTEVTEITIDGDPVTGLTIDGDVVF